MKKILSLIALLLCAVQILASCANTPAVTDEVTTPSGDVTTEPVEDKLELTDLPAEGTLLYYEDFELEGDYTSDELVTALGWEDLGKDGRAINTTTAKLSIRKQDGSKALSITNNVSGGDSNDSYFTILSGDKMKYFSDCAYTVQYDLKYSTASANNKYITLLTDFGGTYYNTLHIRNGAYGNNQYYLAGEFKSYEGDGYSVTASSTSKDKNTVAYKLLGKYYDGTQLLKNISISVRCVVDPQKGICGYVRVNTEGYPGTGVWTAVSELSSFGKPEALPNSKYGGGAVVLKAGNGQNGYIDNVAIWLGKGDEPADKTAPYLDTAKCHLYTENGEDTVCFLCGESYEVINGASEWHLTNAPEYDGGVWSKNAYLAGASALDETYSEKTDSKMQIVTETSEAEFKAYVEKLAGLSRIEKDFYREEEGNIYVAYRFTQGSKKDRRIYAYYYAAEKTARIIEEYGASVTAEQFGYVYDKKEGETTQFYQYGLSDNKELGMLYIVKCADNSVIIIDGGTYQHFDDRESENLMTVLREITGVASDKVRIAAWVITHGHLDHLSGFSLFLKNYGKQVTIERVMYNFPSVYSDHASLIGVRSESSKMYSYIQKSAPLKDVGFYNIHVGEVIKLADVEIEAIYTHEDLVDPVTGKTLVGNDFNNTSTVFLLRFDGYSILITGDVNKVAVPTMMANHAAALKEANAVQTAHHLLNDLSEIYTYTAPTSVFVSAPRSRLTMNSVCKNNVNAFKPSAGDRIYCQCDATMGFEVKDGELVKVYTKNALRTKYTDWSW